MTARALLLCFGCAGAVDDGGKVPGESGRDPAGAVLPPAGSGPSVPGMSPAPGGPAPAQCESNLRAVRAPLRRLTRFEYNNTVRDLLGDTTLPANALPAEETGNGFGNDAAAQAVSSLLAEQYASVAAGIAARATATPMALATLHACAAAVAPGDEEGCARRLLSGLVPRAFRRTVLPAEIDDLIALFRVTRALGGATFATAIAATLEAVLLSPEFLYRVELTASDAALGEIRAVRLSYAMWGTMPDERLRMAAASGQLGDVAGVANEATRMLADPRARQVMRFFFDNLLPLGGLSDLERDRALYPSFAPAIGGFMREETVRLLENEIFAGSGRWPAALTAPYTFVNAALAKFYGLAGPGGNGFGKVPLDGQTRLGFLTQGGLMAGTTPSNHTNPVMRGSFVAQKLLCIKIPLPDASLAEKVKPPDPYSGKTARERFGKHSSDPVCQGCHQAMDPLGLAFENFDAVGLWRNQENGVTIDASGALPGTGVPFKGPVELVRALAESEAAAACFVEHSASFAFGRTLGPDDDCLLAKLRRGFADAGGDVRKLLVALVTSDEFLTVAKGAP